MKNILFLSILFIIFSLQSFGNSIVNTNLKTQSSVYIKDIQTDLSLYSPSDTVSFTLNFNTSLSNKQIRIIYLHLADTVGQRTLTVNQVNGITWKWKTPDHDFTGYMVEAFLTDGSQILDKKNIAVDVSSDWSYFPRYGFISNYPYLTRDSMKAVVSRLNRYHINGLQFYDWQYKHNMPLKGEPGNVAATWPDIANRTIYLSTVLGYIKEAHRHNMKTMAYNLLYGAYSNSYLDGVQDSWGLYKDRYHQNRYMYSLPAGWASDLYFMNPGNTQWQNYIIYQESKVFKALPFDGWHVDQVGDPGQVYDYNGNSVIVKNGFLPLLKAAKDSLRVPLVMNAVNQYGQDQISKAPVDFLYSEVWQPNNTYADLLNIINHNTNYSNGKLSTILAAYMDYKLADNPGTFSTPGVMMTDAVIFAGGGAHLELGEHMLCKEYFPNNNLKMSDELKESLKSYYDFSVAYENLLRDSLKVVYTDIKTNGPVALSSYQQLGTVWKFAKLRKNDVVIHLINLTDATSLNWRDDNGSQPEPKVISGIPLKVSVPSTVSEVWFASPDTNGGSPIKLSFEQDTTTVSFTLPCLKYWDMIVIRLNDTTTGIESGNVQKIRNYDLGQNYPNPFNPDTVIPFFTKRAGNVTLSVYDILGRRIYHKSFYCSQGKNKINFSGEYLNSGIYFYQISTGNFVQAKKMCLLK